ncbi:LysR family transcriptional regulator [Paenibacillus agri]|uniref:LysR family transcriptional regulator n=1 Tax=Paenibacillus agri TaxID=2744309 RepID=A0A850EWM1_9BACL|nr:LysR family transcriptional regulator [Paenibacillus agri]NUU64330.1 LysR family transcriptional regulator [Paenibacillus agri]
MLDFNLEYLRAFYYVANLESTTKAATALFISQPAITRSIRKLEHHLGCALFVRTSKGMKLTNEGEAFYKHVTEAFDGLMSGEKELQRMASFESGRLKIGTTETALYDFLLPKIERFREQFPNVHIDIMGGLTPEAVQLVHSGNADLAVVVTPVRDQEGLTLKNVRSFNDVFIVGTGYPELTNRVVTAREICKYPVVTIEKGTSSRDFLDHWFKEQGILFEPDYNVRTSSMIIPFVMRNLAVGIVPAMFADNFIKNGNMTRLQLDKEMPHRHISILYKRSKSLSLLGRKFIDFVSDEEMDQSGLYEIK